MIIKQVEHSPNIRGTFTQFPNQFKTDEEKQNKKFIKNTLDYFKHIAFHQYKRNRDSFAKNYDLLKGIISWDDFYDKEPEVKDFMSTVLNEQKLPPYVKHYSIVNRPVNTMVGELSRRPDVHRVRAFDDESRSEELQYKTELLQELILQKARNKIIEKFAGQGVELDQEQLEELTVEKVQNDMTDYTSLAERWGNHMLTCMKAELNLKDKSEDAFRDLLTASREFYHVYEDNSKRGFSVDTENPKYVFHSPSNDEKYSKKWYYGGTIKVMEISEIMERFPKITKEEIDHLVMQQESDGYLSPSKSNLDSNQVGPDTIKYDTYDRLLEQERALIENEINDQPNDSGFAQLLNTTASTSPLSFRYSVMQVYFISKKLVGKLTYIDEEGVTQTALVDETYEEGTPGEIDIEWGWVNQWYQGYTIGTEIYHLEPFKCLDYCPIIGVTHEIKNTKAKSLVDLLKPFQALYNVCMNQLWRLLEKEKGNVGVINLRRIPIPKDADAQDAISVWEAEAEERGIIFEDDSPENMKVPSNNTNLTRNVDLSRTAEIKSRYELAVMLKREAMELVGMSEARLGGVAATATATGTQTELTQSFAQTEPYFAQHEYVLDQLYQAILDIAQYVESTKPTSTLSYITGEGESGFIQVTAPDIKLKDLHVLSVHSAQDQQLFNEIRALSQPMLQNGTPAETIIDMYSTNSIRQMKKISKTLREKQEEMLAQQQQLEQQKLEAQQQQFQEQLAEQARQHELDVINENINKELDRKNKLEVAVITAMGRAQTTGTDANADGTPDIYQIQTLTNEADALNKKHEEELHKLNLEREKLLQESAFRKKELTQKDKELELQEKNMANDIKIAQINAKNRAAKAKAKPKK